MRKRFDEQFKATVALEAIKDGLYPISWTLGSSNAAPVF
ncbi:MAG: hypothetical protein A4E71_00044 [Smithella sp. PtaU1.Bin162]|nr:MAG: hypothetical protein A4E71_00044 [Smithella sp. PtaU1.Bin162]